MEEDIDTVEQVGRDQVEDMNLAGTFVERNKWVNDRNLMT